MTAKSFGSPLMLIQTLTLACILLNEDWNKYNTLVANFQTNILGAGRTLPSILARMNSPRGCGEKPSHPFARLPLNTFMKKYMYPMGAGRTLPTILARITSLRGCGEKPSLPSARLPLVSENIHTLNDKCMHPMGAGRTLP